MSSLSFTWSTRRDGNDGFVLEEATTRTGEVESRIEYGPMLPHIVPAFVHARRRIVGIMLSNSGAIRTFE